MTNSPPSSLVRLYDVATPEFYTYSRAAEVVGKANPSTVLDNTSGNAAHGARKSAAAVVALVRSFDDVKECSQLPVEQATDISRGSRDEGHDRWRSFDAGLRDTKTDLVQKAIPAQLFQGLLLSALRHECRAKHDGRVALPNEDGCQEEGGPQHRGELTSVKRRSTGSVVSIALLWRLHEAGLLPLSKVLEASELSPTSFSLGTRNHAESSGDFVSTIVQDMRVLAARSTEESGGPDRQKGEVATALIANVTRHLFDVGYRKCPVKVDDQADLGSTTGVGAWRKEYSGETLSSSAARRALDQLCSGPDMLSTAGGVEVKLRACLAAFSALDPETKPDTSLEVGVVPKAAGASVTVLDGVSESATAAVTQKDELTTTFLARQLRLLLVHASGQNGHTHDDDAGALEAEMETVRGTQGVLADIMRHFPPAEFIEILGSTCHTAVASAASATGECRHKPLLRWQTLGPVIRAAAMAHQKEVPSAIARIGTEVAALAINLAPSGDTSEERLAGCNYPQGVVVLSAALRLVWQADAPSVQERQTTSEGGLYAKWVRSCFGVGAPAGGREAAPDVSHMDVAHAPPDVEYEGSVSGVCKEPHQRYTAEGIRDAMEKQRAFKILMEAMSLSVPSDPAFVLEAHKDVLKSRLRAKFSVQVRDFADLIVTRLSDLKTQEETSNRNRIGGGTRFDHPSGAGGHRATSQRGVISDPTVREVGFFLRQFKQSGDVPPALKTAILWQPKSWAKFRKILLAPPAERIAMPDSSGELTPGGDGVVTEALRAGENGLRVEVSLKYRRLLVQRLAKESLVSAKDHEAFRKAYVEYLQGQREKEQARSPQEEESVKGIAGQLMLLESELKKRQQKDNKSCQGPEGGSGGTNESGAFIRRGLAILLQEYLPRALVMDLCLQEDDDAQGSASPTPNRSETAGHRPPTCSPPTRDWFARAVHLLAQILQDWQRHGRDRSFACVSPLAQHNSTKTEVKSPTNGEGCSSEEVAEAVLNSVHCCVVAVGATLGPLRSPTRARQMALVSTAGAATVREGDDDKDNIGSTDERVCSAFDEERTGPGLLAAQAFRRIGKVISIAARVDALGNALFHRCSVLFANPIRLDPKQALSIAHILAGLPPAFHSRLERALEKLVTTAFQPRSRSGPRDEADGLRAGRRAVSSRGRKANVLATAQASALYLKSTLLLRKDVLTSVSEVRRDESWVASREGAVSSVSSDSRSAGADRRAPEERRSLVTPDSGSIHGEQSNSFVDETVGLAPAALLEFVWWMERRVSIAQSVKLEHGAGQPPSPEDSGLLRLLRGVVTHPVYQGALGAISCRRGSTTPRLGRLVALEMAVSGESNFYEASIASNILESVTLGSLIVNDAGVNLKLCDTGGSREIAAERRSAATPSSRATHRLSEAPEEVRDVWRECVACLFTNSSLRDAAQRKIHRGIMTRDAGRQGLVGGEERAHSWESDDHPSWNEALSAARGRNDTVGTGEADTLLTSVLGIMTKLCSFEATAGSISRHHGPAACSNGESDTCGTAKASGERKVSILFAEALALVDESEVTGGSAVSPVLVLVAEMVIPFVGMAEGRRKAVDCFHLMWEKRLCKVRPWAYGAVETLARTALLLCGAQRETGGNDQVDQCPVLRMLEDLPFLAVEMVRVWPSLARALRPLTGVDPHIVDPHARGGWVTYLGDLHVFGKDLVRYLALGGTNISGLLRVDPNDDAATVSIGPNMASKSVGAMKARARSDGRSPLRPINKYTQGQRDRGGVNRQDGDPEGGGKLGKGLKPRAVEALRTSATNFIREPPISADGLSPLLGTAGDIASLLPHTSASLMVDVVKAAATAMQVSGKRPAPPVAYVSAKKAKTDSCALRTSGGDSVQADVVERSVSSRPPLSSAWSARVLRPLYGPEPGARSLPPLRILLEALLKSMEDKGVRHVCVAGVRLGVCIDCDSGTSVRSLTKSLAVSVLGHAPSLITHFGAMSGPAPSTTAAVPKEGLERSLAVLECIMQLSKDFPARDADERGVRLTVVLSHYAAALFRMSSVQKDADRRGGAPALSNARVWTDIIAFVHALVRAAGGKELHDIPAAAAVSDLDPLLKQYFT